MDGSSIRKVFLNFFAERDHTVVTSLGRRTRGKRRK